MGPKKPNRSPFGLFMMKMKIEDKSLAKKPMNEMVSYCNKFYVKLDPEVKNKFEKLSQFVRNNNCNDIDVITYLKQIQDNNDHNYFEVNTGLTKLRETPQQVIQSSDEETDHFMISYEIVLNAIKSHEDFKSLTFIVISFNVSLQTFDGVYYPNEIGLTKFSLKDGIQQTYHKLIYNQIPQGFQWVAQEFADRTHKLPLNPIDQSFETNYESLFDDIFHFMSSTHLIDSKGKKLVFCKPVDSDGRENGPQIVGCLKWIENKMNKFCDKSFANFKIIDLSELLYVITKPLTNRPKSLFTDDLSKSGYDYSQHISCDFHEQKQNKYCALGMTKRLCYLFFDSFFEYNKDSDLKPTVNHKPVEQKYESIEMPTFKFRDIKTNSMRREERYYSNANNYENRKFANTSTNTSIGIKSNRDFRKPYSAGIGRGKIGANVKKFN